MPAPIPLDSTLLAGGCSGAASLRPLLETVLTALADGAAERCGPLPAGGPAAPDATIGGTILTEHGTGAHEALGALVHALARGAADPADPHCVAHLHCPPLAVAAAADLAASALNPSLDSWDQAPAASALEARVTAELAALVHPSGPSPDALVTTGGTESNLLGVLLARERHPAAPRVICGANAHHSTRRATWLMGLPAPLTLPTPRGVLDPAAVRAAFERLPPGAHALLVATAGTTDSGAIDPLPALADLVADERRRRPASLHVDAAYGGPLLFSARHRHLLAGVERADTVTLDLHKLGWQPIAAGLLTVPDRSALIPLAHRADYLNADDDTEAGLPDLLGRSLRTTRRADVLKIAVTLRALGRAGLAALVDDVLAAARLLAQLIAEEPGLTLHAPPAISTVLFRPTGVDDERVAAVRRRLLADGSTVLGRAWAPDASGRRTLWLKATLLNPRTQESDLAALLKLVLERAADPAPPGDRPAPFPQTPAHPLPKPLPKPLPSQRKPPDDRR
ncbi:pyridoxal phosphate-dependent decarboxylase family protein [Streptomyces triticirhizae]|uniref:Aspartate aminotransferase family protein n=1 Tax=Streptomyces triticirhizae TaxID=2483353 RepID=A0A3M2MAJ3_9ACTN|nr:pyridoxal-dependent decarboxylase [Streptomyces triticirhizae]RMI46501.1 aspartate aminotransferase family protein [Streptomyces triticirhizae]